MQRVSARRCHVFFTTPGGVFGRGLDSALMYERPRAPDFERCWQIDFEIGSANAGNIEDMGTLTQIYHIMSKETHVTKVI